MTTTSVWDEVKDLVSAIQGYVPEHLYNFYIGDFFCTRAQFGPHGFMLLKRDDDDFCTNIYWHEEHPFFDVLTDERRERIIVTEDMIYKQPLVLSAGTPYPVFHEFWKKDPEGRGMLEFFRVDLSLETLVYYERKDGFNAVKRGDLNALAALTDSILGLNSVVSKKISW